MNKKIFVVLALASLFVSTQAAGSYAAVVCYKPDGTTADSNCASCPNSGPGTCTLCATGYVLVSGTCTVCNDANCATCSSTSAGACTACKTNYFLDSGACAATCSDTNCATCSSTSAGACTACKTNYFLDSGACAATCSDTNCDTCSSTSAGACTACKSGYAKISGACTQCSDTNNGVTCTAAATATACTKGTVDTNALCCGPANCATCGDVATITSANTVCATCSTGYYVNAANTCSACTAASNCATCTSALPAACNTCATGYTLTGTAGVAGTTCVASTPVPATSSPSSAFNVTPALVYTSTDTTAPAFSAVSGSTVYGPGFDSDTAYVWLVIPSTVSTTTLAVNRRTINTTAFSKSNSSADAAISTSIPYGASITGKAAPGYLLIASYVAGTNWAGIGGTATASEISITYIAGNGTATTKAITGNTDTNVFYSVKDLFYLNGTAYVVYVMKTHTPGTATTGDTWALNGIYIHGVVLSTGALLNYTTGGVKMLSLTYSNTGTTLGTTANAATLTENQASSFKVGVQNFTQNADTVWYLWSDTSTTNAYTIKLGSINVTTGAATSGTTLTTTAAATGTDPVVSTSYSIAGFHSSDSGSFGAYINKLVTSTTAAGVTTYTSTVLSFINGTSTAQSTLYALAPPTGYTSTAVHGYGTEDGFILVQTAYSQAATTPAQPISAQAQRYYTNGTLYTTSAVALGTYSASPIFYQDTNGTIVFGYTLADTLTSKTYSGYLGSYVVQAMAASTLTSIFAFLSLMIVALFAF